MTIMVRSCDLLWDHMTYVVNHVSFTIHSVFSSVLFSCFQ